MSVGSVTDRFLRFLQSVDGGVRTLEWTLEAAQHLTALLDTRARMAVSMHFCFCFAGERCGGRAGDDRHRAEGLLRTAGHAGTAGMDSQVRGNIPYACSMS